ncbi:hypothetical protein H310_05710 [Aphanomyces invadans]|uniref:Dolichyl-diphosphooligosaccharide-protein glycosyltransferase subunit OST5 n=2 Tax=Aphanomyces invadans TaxID=157072 RepID=A0A024U921_9STRA|nr:hypothetical protein H310_05710 [Aphanomyces invadans]ETW02118.1 hypothetical protein H310_05710 [Aphanomyces invadans]|eukprot:XP_008868723.1 hypothetical protein H310_05710 [Aphanomyces invadans]
MEQPYSSPVSVDHYGVLSLVMTVLGFVFFAGFFTRTVSDEKNVVVETAYAAMASLFLGTGTVFLLLWAGVYA